MGSAAWGYAAPAAGVASKQGPYWVTGMSSGTRPLVDGNAHPAAARTPVWVRFPSLTPTRAAHTAPARRSRRGAAFPGNYGMVDLRLLRLCFCRSQLRTFFWPWIDIRAGIQFSGFGRISHRDVLLR